MPKYVICPRCELNFIDEEVQEYCDVCIKELSGEKTFSDDFEAEEAVEETELCPVCGERYMQYGEKMCDECKKKTEYDEEKEEDEEKEDASWRSFLDDEEETLDLGIPESEFEYDEEEEEEEEEEQSDDEDDFEYVSADDYYDLDDDEDDEDDEDDDDFKSGGRRSRKDEDDF